MCHGIAREVGRTDAKATRKAVGAATPDAPADAPALGPERDRAAPEARDREPVPA